MMKYLVSLMFVVSFSLFSTAQYNVGVEQFKQFKKQAKKQVIDVRRPDEYQQGHIEGAVNIDYFSKDFKERLSKLDKKTPVYVYCRSGGRSAKAMQIMKAMGFEKVYNLKGGFLAWQQATK